MTHKHTAKELRFWAKDMRTCAEDLAPGGKGYPNDCAVADMLLAYAEYMEDTAVGYER